VGCKTLAQSASQSLSTTGIVEITSDSCCCCFFPVVCVLIIVC